MQTQVNMRTILKCISIVIGLLLLYPLYCGAEAEVPPEPLSITFTPAKKPDGELLFTFSLPMTKQEELETATPPVVLFEPELQGELVWRWPNELVFTPQPGELYRGRRVTITIPEAIPIAGEEYALPAPWQMEFAVPGMELAGKVANWPVIQGQPRFMGILNWHSEWVGRGPLFLLYDQPVSVERVAQLIEVKELLSQRVLKRQVFRPESAAQVFDGELDPEYLVAVRLVGLPETGTAVQLSLPSWKEPDKPEILRTSLTVNATFKLTENHSWRNYDDDDDCVPLESSWYFQFNNRFNTDLFRKAFHITPEPQNFDIYGVDWLGIRVYMALEPGTRYQMTVDRSFTDILGNPLNSAIDVSFKSEDLPPQLTLPRGPLLLEREVTRLPIQVRNVENIETHIFRFKSPGDFIQAFEKNREYEVATAGELGLTEVSEQLYFVNEFFEPNTTQNIDLPLEVAPGLLAVEVRAFGYGSEAQGMLTDVILVQTTDFGMTTKVFKDTVFAWITRLHTAAPVENVAVSLYNNDGLISEGVTDDSGVICLEAKEIATEGGLQQPVYVVAEKLGYVAVARLVDDELTQPWMFDIQGATDGVKRLPAAVFADRGAYRPGETVYLKCIVNPLTDLQDRTLHVRIKDPKGQQMFEQRLVLDQYGSAHLEIPLKREAAVGMYLAQVSTGNQRVTRAFLVEEYRVPTFQVHVRSEQESWTTGEDSRAIIAAEYLHGGNLGGREVQWEVLPFQTPSGGLSYWPGEDQPHAFGTAFGATVLIEAKRRGYDVPREVLDQLADYLETILHQSDFSDQMRSWGEIDSDTAALFIATLGRLGRPQPNYASVLWAQQKHLTPFGLAWLAIAVKEMQGEQALLDDILNTLRQAAVIKSRKAYISGKRSGGWSLGSPLRAHAAALTAFARAAPSDELTAKLLDGLLSQRKRGLWGNTQENVFGIMAVWSVVTLENESIALPEIALSINGVNFPNSDIIVVSPRVRRVVFNESTSPALLKAGTPITLTVRNAGGMPLACIARIQYDLPLSGDYRQPRSSGFTLTRQYETLEGQALEGQAIELGALVRVRLRVHANALQNYVAIDDKLPAGLEALHMNFLTTEQVDMGKPTEAQQRGVELLSYHEIRDSRVAFYVDEMLPGDYEFVYVARATTPGRFLRPAGRVEAMYRPQVYGTTSIDEITIEDVTEHEQ